MATMLDQRSELPSDSFLERQILRARRQVQFSDVLNGILRVICLTGTFALVMMVVDRAVQLPLIVRQVAFAGWLISIVWLAYRCIARPLLSAVNPYYTARQVERTIPDAKNSLVNWLDLHDQPLPRAIQQAVSAKAAERLRDADVEEAVRDRRLALWSIMAGLLAVAAIALLLFFRPAQFFSLLNRTFAPFATTAIAQQTTVEILEPVGGHATVPIHQAVDLRALIGGRVPRATDADAARVRIRYSSDDPNWEERQLEPTDRNSEWALRLPPTDVRNGFEYQIVAGDAESPIYRISTKAQALITEFEIRYRYPAYLNFADDVRTDPNLQAVCGTEVTIQAKTNRVVKAGILRLSETDEPTPVTKDASLSAERPDTLRFTFVMRKDGHYKIQFVADSGERSEETLPFEVRVLPDQPPQVDLTHETPEKLPVNGTLHVGGRATDDFGLSKMRLVMKLKTTPDGFAESLPTVHHRPDKPWKLPDGSWPRSEHMQEVLALEKLIDLGGQPIVLRPGMQIVYQFEAEDNCDQPKPQLGKSKEVTVTLIEPQTPEQRDAERQQAQNQKQEHDQQQEKERQGGNASEKKDEQPGAGQSKDKDQSQPPMNPEDQKTIDQAKRLADALNKNDPQSPPPQGQDQPQPPKDSADAKPQPAEANQAQPKGQPPTGTDQNPAPKDGPPKPEQMNPANQQKGNEKSDHSDQKERRPDQMKPGDQGGNQREQKAGESGKEPDAKSGTGPKQDKSTDASPDKSPDRGNADQGQPGSQRADANPKNNEEANQPSEKAISGKSDPNAPKPNQGEPKGADDTGTGSQKPDAKSQPENGKAGTKPKVDQPSAGDTKNQDAAKPHDRPGDQPKTEPKSDGAAGQPKAGDAQPKGGDPKPEDVQKLIDEFKKADPETQKKIIDKLKEMAKNAPTPRERKAADEAAKDCQGQCDNPGNSSNPGGKASQIKTGDSKPGDQSAGAKGGQKGEPKADGQPGSDSAMKSDDRPSKGKTGDKPGDESANAKGGQKGEQKSDGQSGSDSAKKPGDQTGPGQEKTGDTPGSKTAMKGSEKSGPPKDGNEGKAAAQKPGEKMGAADGQGQPKDGAPADQPNQKQDAQGKAQGNQPGTGQRIGEASEGTPPPSGPAAPPNEQFLREAGEMQLEQFRKKVDRKVLEQLRMTEEEYQQFLKSYQDLVKRSKDAPKPDAADKVRGAGQGGSAANTAARKVEAGPKTGPKTDRGGRGVAPPEFRDQYREFTEEQSKQSKSGKP
jgi:hypothetical protein